MFVIGVMGNLSAICHLWGIWSLFFHFRLVWRTFWAVNSLISGPNRLWSKSPHTVSNASFSHLFAVCMFFFFFLLLLLCLRIPAQSEFTAQGSGGVRLHQQALRPRPDQTDHPQPQQGESRAHHTVLVQWLQDYVFLRHRKAANYPKCNPVLICPITSCT